MFVFYHNKFRVGDFINFLKRNQIQWFGNIDMQQNRNGNETHAFMKVKTETVLKIADLVNRTQKINGTKFIVGITAQNYATI